MGGGGGEGELGRIAKGVEAEGNGEREGGRLRGMEKGREGG